MSIIDFMIISIILIFFSIIVYYFSKKEYSNYSDLNTLFFSGTAIIFFITIALSFLSIESQLMFYIYLLATSAILIIHYSFNKIFLKDKNILMPSLFVVYLFTLLFVFRLNNWEIYLNYVSKFLIVLYLLDISYTAPNSKILNKLHKLFFSMTFALWGIYEFLSMFFSSNLLYLLGLVFPMAVAYEFMNIQLELKNEELKKYGQRFKSIFDNASDAFFVVKIDNLDIMNYNKSVREIFEINDEKDLNLNDIFSDDSYNKLKQLISRVNYKYDKPVELSAFNKNNEEIFLETDISFMEYTKKDAAIIAMKDKTDEIELKNKVMENKNKIEKLHDIAIKMENSAKREEIYKYTVDAAEEILDYDVISLDVVKDNELIAVGKSQNLSDDDVKSMSLDEISLATKAYHEQRTIICNNIPAERDASPVSIRYKSALTVPIQKYGTFQIIAEEYDYFTKDDKNLVELLISHTGAALKRLNREEEIRYFGFHDYLTGLYNRDYIEEEIKRLDNARQLPISLIMADVNGLKLINDTFGHDDGDKLLKKISNNLYEVLRKEDIIGRWGGDEFLVVLPKTNSEDVKNIVCRMEKSLEKETHKDIPLSVSFGYATKLNKENKMEEIKDIADRRMYNNKSKNKTKTSQKMLNVLYNKLNEKGYETEAHCQRVEGLIEVFAKKLNFSKNDLDSIKKTARIHDIGMINIPRKIVMKENELTEEEYKIIQTHPEVGFRIANSLNESSDISNAILHHHEWWDGSGYPQNKKGDDIPLYSRIISIVDAFDIMTHNQIYKKKITKEKAISKLRSMAGIQFDPKLTRIFIKHII